LFPTRRVARRWVLERLDADVRAEQASIRNQILRLHLAA
jgi:hypothetical protein